MLNGRQREGENVLKMPSIGKCEGGKLVEALREQESNMECSNTSAPRYPAKALSIRITVCDIDRTSQMYILDLNH
jgi:hypothetical protein